MSDIPSAILDKRHHIRSPNSDPRNIRLIGIGDGGQRIADDIAAQELTNVAVFEDAAGEQPGGPPLQRFLDGADMVVVVVHADDDVEIPAEIRGFASAVGVQITGVLLQPGVSASGGTDIAGAPAVLPRLRAASDMLILAADESYIGDMLVQFGA